MLKNQIGNVMVGEREQRKMRGKERFGCCHFEVFEVVVGLVAVSYWSHGNSFRNNEFNKQKITVYSPLISL